MNYYRTKQDSITLYHGDCAEILDRLPSKSVNCCVTSPPYFGMRDYGVAGQYGLESTPDDFARNIVEVFKKVRRVLKDDGTVWLNLGDTYATGTKAARKKSPNGTVGANNPGAQNSVARVGTPPGYKTKDLLGVPWLVAFALRSDGWYLRQEIIWHKPNAAPGGRSTTDRCEKSHEHIFLLSKSQRYNLDLKGLEVAAKSGAKKVMQDVWSVPVSRYKGAHFATFPEELIEPCVMSGCPEGGVVLDPFSGSGTTGIVASRNNRNYIGIDINKDYLDLTKTRIEKEVGSLFA